MDRDKLRHRIVEKRTELKINQAELARRTKLSPAAICQFESGIRYPTLPSLQKIADALAVSIDYLVARSDFADIAVPQVLDEYQEFFRDFMQLSPEDKKFIKYSVKFFKQR